MLARHLFIGFGPVLAIAEIGHPPGATKDAGSEGFPLPGVRPPTKAAQVAELGF